MNNQQIDQAIKALLDLAEAELEICKACQNVAESPSWAAAMTASKIFSGLVTVLYEIRKADRK